jgi:hypothetical protein
MREAAATTNNVVLRVARDFVGLAPCLVVAQVFDARRVCARMCAQLSLCAQMYDDHVQKDDVINNK